MSTLDRMLQAVRTKVASGPSARRRPLDEAALHERHAAATDAAAAVARASARLGSLASDQQSALAALTDAIRLLSALARDQRTSLDQVRDAVDRARLVALNAGLEGARVGEPTGKALVVFGEESRTLLARALEAVAEPIALSAQVDQEHDRLRDQVDQAQRRASDLTDQIAASVTARAQAEAALQALGETLERVTGTDPETARALAAAARHARGLFEALSSLSVHSRGRVLTRALGPSLAPLRRILHEIGSSFDEPDPT
jgi:methyl-accepting chemotaxis protein